MDHATLLKDFRQDAGLSVVAAAAMLGRTTKQIRRWEMGSSPVPPWAMALLQAKAGDLAVVHAAWKGWVINPHGELIGPTGEAYSVQWFYEWHWYHQQLAGERAYLRSTIKKQARIIDELRAKLPLGESAEIIPFRPRPRPRAAG